MKRFITLSLSALIMLAALTACGKESPNESAIEQTVSEDSTQTIDVTESTEELSSSSAEETVISHTQGEFNIDDAVNDIVIDGKRYKVPTTLDELGEDYLCKLERETNPTDRNWGNCITSVIYNNELPVLGAYTQKNKSDKVDKKDKVFCVYTLDSVENSTVYGLSVGDKLETMLELWGEPTEIVEESITHYCYGGTMDDLKCISVGIKDGYVKSIEVLNK